MKNKKLTLKEIDNFKKIFKQMVLSNEPETIISAVGMAEGLDDERLYDIMLDGIRIEKKSNRLLPSDFFMDNGPRGIPKEWGTYNTSYPYNAMKKIINNGFHPYRFTAMTGILNAASKYPKWQAFVNEIKELRSPCFYLDFLNCFKNLDILYLENGDRFEKGIDMPCLKKIFWYSFGHGECPYDETGISLHAINKCHNLTHLEIEGNLFLPDGFEGIDEMRNLETLIVEKLQGNFLSGFSPLGSCKKISILSINKKTEYPRTKYDTFHNHSSTIMNSPNYQVSGESNYAHCWVDPPNVIYDELYPPVNISNLKGLENLYELKVLILKGFHSLTDTTALTNCKNLEEIHIFSNSVANLVFHKKLPQLRKLKLKCKELKTIACQEYPDMLEEFIIESNKFKFS
jgi:hypothetical protein